MQQSMNEIEKLFTSTTKAVETSYEAQLQQHSTELAALYYFGSGMEKV